MDNDFSQLIDALGDNPKEALMSMLAAASDSDEKKSNAEKNDDNSGDSSPLSDLFSGIDLNTIMKVQKIFSKSSKNDDRSNLLKAIRPFLADEQRPQIDQIIKILRYYKMYEVAKEEGIFNDFKLL